VPVLCGLGPLCRWKRVSCLCGSWWVGGRSCRPCLGPLASQVSSVMRCWSGTPGAWRRSRCSSGVARAVRWMLSGWMRLSAVEALICASGHWPPQAQVAPRGGLLDGWWFGATLEGAFASLGCASQSSTNSPEWVIRVQVRCWSRSLGRRCDCQATTSMTTIAGAVSIFRQPRSFSVMRASCHMQ
jgi:hypothetical protein